MKTSFALGAILLVLTPAIAVAQQGKQRLVPKAIYAGRSDVAGGNGNCNSLPITITVFEKYPNRVKYSGSGKSFAYGDLSEAGHFTVETNPRINKKFALEGQIGDGGKKATGTYRITFGDGFCAYKFTLDLRE